MDRGPRRPLGQCHLEDPDRASSSHLPNRPEPHSPGSLMLWH